MESSHSVSPALESKSSEDRERDREKWHDDALEDAYAAIHFHFHVMLSADNELLDSINGLEIFDLDDGVMLLTRKEKVRLSLLAKEKLEF